MSSVSTEPSNVHSVRARIKYLSNPDGQSLYKVGVDNQKQTQHLGDYEFREVEVNNARVLPVRFDLQKHGFSLVKQCSGVSDFYSDSQLHEVYNQEVVTTITDATGASRVEVFDHTRRSSSKSVRSARDIREPASVIHNDYSASSGLTRLQDYIAASEEDLSYLQTKRFSIINLWRSINGPVHNSPLALCDANSTEANDLIPIKRESKERVGELQVALYNAKHRWYYYPQMQMDEALLIKTYDSDSQAQTRFTLHTAFDLPGDNTAAEPRESLETRCFVFYDE